MNKHYRYIILGAGAAAVSAAEGIRSVDPDGSVLMIGEEPLPAYSRPMLTKAYLSAFDPERFFLHGQEWYEANRITLLTGTSATAVDAAAHTVTAGGCYGYEKLIYAAGAAPFVPPVAGCDLPQVAVIRTASDILSLKRLCVGASRAVIIGGGVIGLEAAFELNRFGIDVTVLEALPRLMPRFLDEECADRLTRELSDIPIHTGVSVEKIGGEGAVEYVRLADGRTFDCDFVIFAAGVRARTALLEEAGIACERGVLIDESCRTSDEDIYACGDCASMNGINRQLWGQALTQGRCAGMTAAGGQSKTGPFDSSVILHAPSCALFSCGDIGSIPGQSYETQVFEQSQPALFAVNKRRTASFEKRFYLGGKLVGAVIIGNLAGMQALKEEILGIGWEESDGRC